MRFNTLALSQLASTTNQKFHHAPSEPFTVSHAHQVMQFHVACRAKRCPRKCAALQALIDAGRVVSSMSQPR
ncbi:hypothetical protein [Nocardia asiatica]|uniref:hypothetical protein n=1 Tax=Nocardia asiatica TaxID=209252 RepID=UPI0024551DE3|nr:hypothetical protein [Nocardia asiatica]